EFHVCFPALAMSYTKAPQACKALLAYLLEAEQFNKWLEASVGYLTQPLNAYDSNPIWTADPKNTIFREAAKRTLTAGGPGAGRDRSARRRRRRSPTSSCSTCSPMRAPVARMLRVRSRSPNARRSGCIGKAGATPALPLPARGER